MKKSIALLLVFVLTLAILLPTAFAETSAKPSSSSPETSPDASASPSEDTPDKPNIKADSALLIDVKTQAVLLEKDPDKQIVPASTTKILTSLLVVEKGDLSKKVTVGDEITDGIGSASSKVPIKAGETLTIENLLYGMMIKSGNDAANALAKAVGGSIDGFVTMMNEKAKELGMTKSAFVNAHGIDKEGHFTTANDMAKLTLKALENTTWKKIFTTNQYNMPQTNKQAARTLDTTDKLMSSDPADQEFHYAPVKGGKTGLTPYNGGWNGCIVAYAEKDGRQLLCLIFGDHDKDANHRFVQAKTILEWGFDQPAPIDLADALSGFTITAQVKNVADTEDSDVEFAPDLSKGFPYTGSSDMADKIKSNMQNLGHNEDWAKDLKAPLRKGEVVGTITIKYLDTVLGKADLIATRDVAAAGQEAAGIATSNSPSSPVQPQPTKELFPGGSISPWWWLLLPVILIVIIILRVMAVNRRQRSRFRNKRKVYNYRIR